MRYSVILKLIAVLLCLLAPLGCDRSAKEREEEAAKAQNLREEKGRRSCQSTKPKRRISKNPDYTGGNSAQNG